MFQAKFLSRRPQLDYCKIKLIKKNCDDGSEKQGNSTAGLLYRLAISTGKLKTKMLYAYF